MITLAVTGLAAIIALSWRRGALTWALFAAWAVSLFAAVALPYPLLPGVGSIVDAAVALAALALWTERGSQRARCVGLVSLAKIFVHFGISAGLGSGNWWLYAITINSLFVLQCGIAGGLFHGVVRFIDSVSPRSDIRRTNHNSGGK